MPYQIKQKIKQYNAAVLKANALERDLYEMFEDYNIPTDNLVALADIYGDEPQTEALSYISNGECVTEEGLTHAINEIEDVFIHFANKI